MNEQKSDIRWEYQTEPREGMGAVVWAVAALGLCIAIVMSCGCANMRPVVNENGGGGVAITTTQGSWLTPVVLVGGVSYALVELFDSLKDRPNTYNGTYINNAGNGTVNLDSGNDNSTAAHAKRIKAEGRVRK